MSSIPDKGRDLANQTESRRPWGQVFYIGDPDVICLAWHICLSRCVTLITPPLAPLPQIHIHAHRYASHFSTFHHQFTTKGLLERALQRSLPRSRKYQHPRQGKDQRWASTKASRSNARHRSNTRHSIERSEISYFFKKPKEKIVPSTVIVFDRWRTRFLGIEFFTFN
jgi:hypothetical protein